MKTMATAAGLQGRKTNHSARKTMCARLITNDVTPTHVAQLSGHKNLKSLDSYASASTTQQKMMSNIFTGHGQKQPLNDTTNSAVCLPSSTCNAFSGLSVSGNQTVNIYISSQATTASYVAPPAKRKRVILDSSDEES